MIDLTEAEVLPAMEAIVDSDIFDDDGMDRYAAVAGARYVRTTVEDIFDADEEQ